MTTDVSPIGGPCWTCGGLSAGYGAQPVVHDVDLEVRAGRGRRAARPQRRRQDDDAARRSAGELPLLGGEVASTARDARRRSTAARAPGLGFVTEERSVFKTMSRVRQPPRGDADPKAALELFPELEKRLSVRGGLLSGGEQQMLTLARALSREAPPAARRRALARASRRSSSSACSRPCAAPPTSAAPASCSSSSTFARRSSTSTGRT